MKSFFLLLMRSGMVISLLVSGCVRSVQPLSARADARPEPRLVGTWRAVEKSGEPESVVRVSFDEHGIGHVKNREKDGGFEPTGNEFFVTRTDRHSFLNVQGPPAEHGSLYTFYRYQISDDLKSIRLWTFRLKTFEQAVTAGQLKGEVTKEKTSDDPGSGGTDVTLQSSSGELLKFIEARPENEIFEDLGIFKKVD